ncbi:hypothetical protein [Thalassomonas actiniarum]|uniref:Uncharacterized protein n=1 Tax=Thalassomonas actiniarum TaxID=485447 RepID=A0AAF0C596_9GAMM|nr:hypothetical protein [Thalassomonas actiniarum]WDE00630.1 hypothetical protein SG35_008345 [Thalassomonas actiniarum]
MIIDDVIDKFVDSFDLQLSMLLLKTIALPEQGGLGYKITFFNPTLDIDGYEVEHKLKLIRLDTSGLFSKYSAQEVAESLKSALQVDIAKTHAGLLSRVAWGTGKVMLGVIETGIGFIGIIIPEPGTTAAGFAVTALGVNTVADGFLQLAGANKGHGYNVLGQGAGAMGSKIATLTGGDPQVGRSIGKGIFIVTSIAVGSFGSIRILKVPGQTFLRTGLGGQAGGIAVGRVDMLYGSYRAKDGLTIFSINNNAGQSILRFVTHNGKLIVNARIVGVQRILKHENKPQEVLKGLLKLLAYGAKQGW